VPCAEESFIPVAQILNYNLSINSKLTDISTVGQLQQDNLFKNFESSWKSWSVSISEIYVDSDVSQTKLLEALDQHKRVFIKIVPFRTFGENGLRTVFIGSGYVVGTNIKNNLQSAVGVDITIIGSGPLDKKLESETNLIECENICCETLNESIYMFNGQTFNAPPAPSGSTGWMVEKAFESIETGTGDIGTIVLNASGAGLSGCPVHVVYRYLCQTSPHIPDTSKTAIEQFQEIYDKTQSDEQMTIIKMLEELLGFRIGANGTASELWYAFNYDFLADNPFYILDLSQMGLSDLHIVKTLTNLKGIDVSFNNLSFADIEIIQDLELFYLKADHNLLGQWSSALVGFADTIKHLDISYNFITENFLFDTLISGTTRSLDLFDISHNILSFYRCNRLRVKELYIRGNRYPNDSFYGNGYWESRKANANSSCLLASVFPQLCQNFIDLEALDISELELIPVDDISALITQIATDKSITTPEAENIVTFSPTFTEVLPVEQFNPLTLPRNWI